MAHYKLQNGEKLNNYRNKLTGCDHPNLNTPPTSQPTPQTQNKLTGVSTMQYTNETEINKLDELQIRARTLNELLKAYVSENGEMKPADKLYLVTTVLPLITDSLDFICDGMADVSNSLVQNQQEVH